MDEATPAGPKLDVGACLTPAFAYVKERLFSPFAFETWLTLGFVSFLDQLANGGGGGFPNFNAGNGPFGGGDSSESPEDVKARVLEFLTTNLPWIAAIVVVGLVVVLLILYLGARGTFMYIDNVARRKAEVAGPWRRSGLHATSYFLWILSLGFLSLVTILAVCAPAGVLLWRLVMKQVEFGGEALGLLLVTGVILIPILLVFGVAGLFLHDFVAPLMYRFGLPGLEAWRLFLRAIRGHAFQIFLFVLLRIAIGTVLGVASLAVMLCTCCLGLLPVIHQTIVQPVLLFARVYPLYVLERLAPEFRIVEPAPDLWASPPPGDQDHRP